MSRDFLDRVLACFGAILARFCALAPTSPTARAIHRTLLRVAVLCFLRTVRGRAGATVSRVLRDRVGAGLISAAALHIACTEITPTARAIHRTLMRVAGLSFLRTVNDWTGFAVVSRVLRDRVCAGLISAAALHIA